MSTPPALARRLVAGLPGAPGAPLLDPCCGEGALLVAACELRGGALAGLHGLEILPDAARRARERLRAAAGDGESAAAEAVRVADALAPEPSWPAGTAVVANPPWVSFSGRRSAGAGAAERPPGGGWPSLQGAFLERMAAHVAAEGTAARVLLPATVAEGTAYGPLRRAVTALVRLAEPAEELGERAFPGVVEPAVIVTLLPLGRRTTPSAAVWTRPRGDAARLLAALADRPRLAPEAFADVGVHTGNAAAELLHAAPGPGRTGLRQGRDLAPFALGPPSAWLRTDLAPGGGRRFRIAPLERYRGFPLLVRQTADRPVAALHAAPGAFRNSLLAGRRLPELDPAFVVAVLNGPVAAAWHRARFQDARQRTFPQVKIAHLRTQPIPVGARRESPRLHDAVVEAVHSLRIDAPGAAERRRALEELVLAAFGLPAELVRAVCALAAPRSAAARTPAPGPEDAASTAPEERGAAEEARAADPRGTAARAAAGGRRSEGAALRRSRRGPCAPPS